MHIWVLDENHRVYDDNRKLIWRECWVKHEVESETSRSWILNRYTKIPKKPNRYQRSVVAFSEEEIDQKVFVHDTRNKLADKVRSLDYTSLKEVEKIIERNHDIL